MGYIGKVNIGGTQHLVASTLYGTCSSLAEDSKKIVDGLDNVFNELITGVTIHVKFTNSNTYATPTLQVGSTTAKQIRRYGTTKPGTTAASSWNAGAVVSFTYDGTYWQMNDWLNTNTNTWRNVYVNGTPELGTGTGTGSLNFLDGTNTTVSYNSGIQVNLNDNVVLGSPNNEGTLTLFSGDTVGASTGVLHQGLTTINVHHYLPVLGGDLFGSGNLVAGEGISRSESSGIYTISTKSDIVLSEVDLDNTHVDNKNNYIQIDEFVNLPNKKYYIEIYYTANNGKNPGVARIPLINGVVPSRSGEVGSEFTLNITGDINTTYIRTGCFKFKTPTNSYKEIRLYGQSSFAVTFANPSGTSSETKNSYTIQKKTVSNGDYTGFWVVPYKMRFIQEKSSN